MNQNLAKLLGQLHEIWKQLGVPQRASVIGATAVLLGGFIALSIWSSRPQYSLLYGKLSDTESAKVIQALDDAKVAYKIGAGGSSILVPADKVHVMRMQLAGRGIPRGDGVGFEIFDKPNFGISDFVQRANYLRAVQGELARTIGQIDEVESARVMIVLPENRLLLDKDKHSTASVFVRVRGNAQLQPQSINSIRFLVANSVEGLKPNFVSVVDNLGNVLSENNGENTFTGMATSQLAACRDHEQHYTKKVQDMLDAVLGPGQAIVRVAADINFDSSTRTEEKYDPDNQVIRTQTKEDESNDTTTTASGTATAGVSGNLPSGSNTTQTVAAPLSNTRNKKGTTSITYELSKITSNQMQAAGSLRRLSAAVTIAARFEGQGAERKMVPRSKDELDKLKNLVQSALGIQKGADGLRHDEITLEELPFNDQFAADLTRELDLQKRQEFWWELARTVAYPALGLIALVTLVLIFKRTPVQDIPLGVPVGRLVHARNGNGNGNGNGHRPALPDWGRELRPDVVTVDVLNRLVKENPANMSQAIRDWMNKSRAAEQ
jgi:flagellar M-ring protein FliF